MIQVSYQGLPAFELHVLGMVRRHRHHAPGKFADVYPAGVLTTARIRDGGCMRRERVAKRTLRTCRQFRLGAVGRKSDTSVAPDVAAG